MGTRYAISLFVHTARLQATIEALDRHLVASVYGDPPMQTLVVLPDDSTVDVSMNIDVPGANSRRGEVAVLRHEEAVRFYAALRVEFDDETAGDMAGEPTIVVDGVSYVALPGFAIEVAVGRLWAEINFQPAVSSLGRIVRSSPKARLVFLDILERGDSTGSGLIDLDGQEMLWLRTTPPDEVELVPPLPRSAGLDSYAGAIADIDPFRVQ